MKNVKLDLHKKKQTPASKEEKTPTALNADIGEKGDLVSVEDMARVLDIESRRELRALLTSYPSLANDPEVHALDAAIQDDINNRFAPGIRSLQTQVRQQRTRIEDLRRKLKAVEEDVAVAAEGRPHVPGRLPEVPHQHFPSDHTSEYAVLAKEAHRATQHSRRRGRNKVADETDSHDDQGSDEAPTDTHNDGQSLTDSH